MSRTVWAVIVLVVVVLIAGFLFYDGTTNETVVDEADQTTPSEAPGGAPASPPAPAP